MLLFLKKDAHFSFQEKRLAFKLSRFVEPSNSPDNKNEKAEELFKRRQAIINEDKIALNSMRESITIEALQLDTSIDSTENTQEAEETFDETKIDINEPFEKHIDGRGKEFTARRTVIKKCKEAEVKLKEIGYYLIVDYAFRSLEEQKDLWDKGLKKRQTYWDNANNEEFWSKMAKRIAKIRKKRKKKLTPQKAAAIDKSAERTVAKRREKTLKAMKTYKSAKSWNRAMVAPPDMTEKSKELASGHRRGAAIDAWAIPIGEKPHPKHKKPPHTNILKETMVSVGFHNYEKEIWHYSINDHHTTDNIAEMYPAVDEPFFEEASKEPIEVSQL